MQNPTASPTPPQRDCDRLRELIPAYSIGATDPDETALVERLLGECPEVAEELADYAQLARAMAYTMPPAAPPVGLHDRLLANARAMKTSESTAKPSTPPATPQPPNVIALPRPSSGDRRRTLRLLAGAAALLLLVLSNVYWYAQVRDLMRQQQDTTALMDALLFAAAASEQRLLEAAAPAETARLRIAWEGSLGVLVALDLPPLPPDQTYQLWLFDGDTPVSAGVFQVNANRQAALRFTADRQVADYGAVAISREPAGGSPQPTTDPLAVGSLAPLPPASG